MKEVILLIILFMVFILIAIIITPILHHSKFKKDNHIYHTDLFCTHKMTPQHFISESIQLLNKLCEQQNHHLINIFIQFEQQFLTETDPNIKQEIHNKMLYYFPNQLDYHKINLI